MKTREPDNPLLLTKLYRPPTRDGLVNRPRLLTRLDASIDQPITLITAPAGYGKTTLVTNWLDAAGLPHAWLSLDENDSELATFVAYLVAAVRQAFPEMGEAADAALRAPTMPGPAVLADLFLHDLAGLPRDLFVVLDDYHTVSSQEVRAFMERLIQYMPSRLHLALLARADPLLSLGQLRGRGQLTEIRGADLRFTMQESADLLQQIVGGDLSRELIALLTERTEGWPVGLQLAAISLRDSADREAFLRRFAQSNNRLLTDYLMDGVLDRLPEAERDLLLRTSVLDRFCAPLCEVVSDVATPRQGADFIDSVWRANLFITALDDEGVWYRYHHLFRDLLRHQLRLSSSAETVAELHRRAGAWFENAGLTEEAIAHATEAGDGLRAAQLVEANWHHALNREDWRLLERWIAMLPEPLLQRPALLIAQAYLHHFRHKVAAILPLVEAAASGLEGDSAGYTPAQRQRLLGGINTLRATSFVPGSPESMVSASRTALTQLGPEMVFERSLAELWHIYGLQQSGQSAAAEQLAQGLLDQQSGQPDVRTLRLLLALCGVYYDEANLPMLIATGTTYCEFARRLRRGLSLAWANFLLGYAHYQRNELDAAVEYFGQVVESPYEAHSKAAIDSFVGQALTRCAQDRGNAADDAVRSLREFLLDRGTANLMPFADSLAMRIDNIGDPPAAPGGFAGDLEGQMAADVWETPALTTVRLALRSGAPDRLAAAAEILRSCDALAESRHRKRRRIEIAVLAARVHGAQGDDASALEAVRRAVQMGEPGGALRFFLDEGTALRPYLRKLLDQGVAPAYVQAILAAYPADEASRPPIAVPRCPPAGKRRPRPRWPACSPTAKWMSCCSSNNG